MSGDVDTDGQIITGEDMPSFFNAHSRALLRHCAAIIAKGKDGRVIAKGTATFVLFGDRRFVLTAKHVTDELKNRATLLLPPVSERGDVIVGAPRQPEEIAWRCELLWTSDALDVAIVEPPTFNHNLVSWFDLSCCHPRARTVRRVWLQYSSENGSLPFAVCGYPNFGHLRDESAHQEILAALPLFAYIDEWTDSAMPFNSKTSAQIHVEAVAEPREAAELAVLPPIEKLMASRLKDATVENTFGGYSGGPFVIFDRTGVHLLGTIKEGGWLFSTKAQFYASPLEDVLAAAGITV